MEEYNLNVVYELYPSYNIELSLQDAKYPLSRESINEFLKLIEDTEEEVRFKNDEYLLKTKSKNIAELLGISRTPKLLYVNPSRISQYKICINNYRLTYSEEPFSYVDSNREFFKIFERTPEEDDEFLDINGYSMHPHRRGKSSFSCLVLDKNKNIFIFPYRANTIQHTFITRGDGVYFAGTIKVVNGLIDYIDDNSGHYRPHPSSILSVAYHFKEILQGETHKLFSDDFNIEKIKLVDSSAHTQITFLEKESIRRKFIEIVDGERTL